MTNYVFSDLNDSLIDPLGRDYTRFELGVIFDDPVEDLLDLVDLVDELGSKSLEWDNERFVSECYWAARIVGPAPVWGLAEMNVSPPFPKIPAGAELRRVTVDVPCQKAFLLVRWRCRSDSRDVEMAAPAEDILRIWKDVEAGSRDQAVDAFEPYLSRFKRGAYELSRMIEVYHEALPFFIRLAIARLDDQREDRGEINSSDAFHN